MKKLDKIKLIDMIATELQQQMTFSEIDSYFETYNIPTDHEPSYNSKRVYVKEVLPAIDDTVILEIADELKLKHSYGSVLTVEANVNNDSGVWKAGYFKLFLSHLATFKTNISLLKNELEKYGISSFVAHEDIEPATEWQIEIEKGLYTMDALCAILMPGFKESNWTDQEVGVAIGRQILVIPVRKGLDPYGFIGKYQGIQSNGKNIGQVAESIFKIISTHEKTRTNYINSIVNLLLLSNRNTLAQDRIKALNKIRNFPIEKAQQINSKIIENKIFKYSKTLSMLNEFFEKFELKLLKPEDFETEVVVDSDDLPF